MKTVIAENKVTIAPDLTITVVVLSDGQRVIPEEDMKRACAWLGVDLACAEADVLFQEPQIEKDGWIEWRGGEHCADPVEGLVEVKFRNGITDKSFSRMLYWQHCGDDADIIAYRVIENDGREG